jgi:hypothetical protein
MERPNFGEEQLIGKETHVRKSCMQRRKASKVLMQENLTTFGLGIL